MEALSHEDHEKLQMEEFVSTEKTYVKQLDMLVNVFLKSFREEEVMEEEDFDVIFQNIEMIRSLHKTLLSKFLTVLANTTNDDRTSEMVKVFEKYIGGLGIYSQYCGGLPHAQRKLDELAEKYFGQTKFVRTIQRIQSQHKVTLDSLLINPLQRITRYELLFNVLIKSKDKAFEKRQEEFDKEIQAFDERRMEYMKETRHREKEFEQHRMKYLREQKNHQDEQASLDKIRNTISNLQTITSKANARKTDEESRIRVMELCETIRDCRFDLSSPVSRKYKGERFDPETKTTVFLFDDLVLWTKDTGIIQTYHEYQKHICLDSLKDCFVTSEGTFRVSGDDGKALTISVPSEEQDEWRALGRKILDTSADCLQKQEEFKRNGENELRRMRRDLSAGTRKKKFGQKLKMTLRFYDDKGPHDYVLKGSKTIDDVLKDISKMLGGDENVASNPYISNDDRENSLLFRQCDIKLTERFPTKTM